MLSRRLITFKAGDEPYDRVLIIQPPGQEETSVYLPPDNGVPASVEVYSTREEAEARAGAVSHSRGQRVVLMTRDRVEWWLPDHAAGA